jgi:uncharacterized phosphosugar-binding protein
MIYLFGTGHSHLLAEEGHFRAGGLAPVCPILVEPLMLHQSAVQSSQAERTTGISQGILDRYHPIPGDVLVIFSNSGVNAVPVEMAMAGHQAGMTVITVVALQYEARAKLGAAGKKLSEVADIVIDNGGVMGDAVVRVGEDGIYVGPTSTVTGAFILNAILAEAAARLIAGNMPAPIYVSSNVPGASERNSGLLARYRSRNPHL